MPYGNTPSTYLCNYCGVEHLWATRSEEHIVARLLGNDSLVLKDVCGYRNNFFACAFETEVTKSPFMRDVLLEFRMGGAPPKGVHYMGPVTNVDGGQEHLWVVNGKPALRDMPVRSRVNTVRFPAFDAKGVEHAVDVTLPFEYLASSQGDHIELRDAKKLADRDMARLLQYLQDLARDPSVNPAIAAELAQRGLQLRMPKKVLFDTTVTEGTPGTNVNVVDQGRPVDPDLWGRFYLKIGWCFACARLGRSQLATLGGQSVVDFLATAGEVDVVLVEACTAAIPNVAAALFRDVTLGDKTVWFWKPPITEIPALLASLPRDVQSLAALSHELRKTNAMAFRTWVHFEQVGYLDRKKGPPSAGDREHRLRLRKVVHGDEAVIACTIRLFGGVFIATVQVTSRRPKDRVPDVDVEEVIRFAP